MERRHFIKSVAGGLIGAVLAPSLDLEKYFWVKGKTIFIPANIPANTIAPEEFTGLAIRYSDMVELLNQTNDALEGWKVDDAWGGPSNFPVLSEANIYPAGSTAGLSGLMLSAAERIREGKARPVFYMTKPVFDLQQEIAARKGWLHAFRRKINGCR